MAAKAIGLSQQEILVLVHDFLGADSDGYLPYFSYNSHEEFYPRFCNLEVDVAEARKRFGTTKKAFVGILKESPPEDQVKILEGVISLVTSERTTPPTASQIASVPKLRAAIERLRGAPAVPAVDTAGASKTVREALKDASTLLKERGSASGLDRLHTAFHGFLRALCSKARIEYKELDEPSKLWGLLRRQAAELQIDHPEREAIERLLNGVGTIVSSLDTLRNRATLAHPNPELLPPLEAALAIDALHTATNYLARRFGIQ